MNKRLEEFTLIRKISKMRTIKPSDAIAEIGEDCFVVPTCRGKSWAITTDILVEGVHFSLAYADPYSIGIKAAAANLSDLAAVGAKPLFALLGLSLPNLVEDSAPLRCARGFVREIEDTGCSLVGGDITRAPQWTVSVTMIGELGKKRLLRSCFSPGDLVAVTGGLGVSTAGLKLLMFEASGIKAEISERTASKLKKAHLRPKARTREAQALAELGVCGAIDLSDGLASDLRRVSEASGVGITIDESSLPIPKEVFRLANALGLDPYDLAVRGGEDYELLFALPEEKADKIMNAFKRKFPKTPVTVIGKVTKSKRLLIRRASGKLEPLPEPEFVHFG